MSVKTIVITGCSLGGLGDSLARELKARGQRVIATGRNLSKLSHFKELGIETCSLDTLSDESIKQAVETISASSGGKIDMLINNAGGGLAMPLMDVDISKARDLFELNVWSVLAVTKAFVPLLLKSPHGTVVNNTSVVSLIPTPASGIYTMSKAAAAMMTDVLRLELAPFGLKVVELKTGAVKSNFFNNQDGGTEVKLPESSMYLPAREPIEHHMGGEELFKSGITSDVWAKQVAGDLLSSSPPRRIWRGGDAWLVWFMRRFAPIDALDSFLNKSSGMNALRQALAKK